MSTKTEIIIETASELDTGALGQFIGGYLKKGAVLRLEGTLGCGKTCFVRGLALGLDVDPAYDIVSPSYTLVNLYPGRLQLVHADLYRLQSPVDAEALGLLEWFDTNAVVAVEWAEKLNPADWPAESMVMRWEMNGKNRRRIKLIGYGLAWRDLIKIADRWRNKQ